MVQVLNLKIDKFLNHLVLSSDLVKQDNVEISTFLELIIVSNLGYLLSVEISICDRYSLIEINNFDNDLC